MIDLNLNFPGTDINITNVNWVIQGDGSTLAIFRIRGGSNLVVNQSTIGVGDGGIAGARG